MAPPSVVKVRRPLPQPPQIEPQLRPLPLSFDPPPPYTVSSLTFIGPNAGAKEGIWFYLKKFWNRLVATLFSLCRSLIPSLLKTNDPWSVGTRHLYLSSYLNGVTVVAEVMQKKEITLKFESQDSFPRVDGNTFEKGLQEFISCLRRDGFCGQVIRRPDAWDHYYLIEYLINHFEAEDDPKEKELFEKELLVLKERLRAGLFEKGGFRQRILLRRPSLSQEEDLQRFREMIDYRKKIVDRECMEPLHAYWNFWDEPFLRFDEIIRRLANHHPVDPALYRGMTLSLDMS
ncbi:MAG TPA: hypothetical protein DHV52_02945 [Parachlamydiales bacterium]|nr:MAG: hypothetical protein A3D18_05665 [Chlamydiae bacterium RIFCSPHIGHO2_02_FULL_49_29]HCJ83274.1 hypothetical protein [Parachlamydiales bacterium]